MQSQYFHLESKLLKGCRNPYVGRLVALNTRAKKTDSSIVITYYKTDILECAIDGTMTFRVAGWHTRSTRNRLNKYSPNQIYFFSHKGESIVSVKGYWYQYREGMRITRDLTVIGAERTKMPKRLRYTYLMILLQKVGVTEEWI